jgi:hypothetical protein
MDHQAFRATTVVKGRCSPATCRLTSTRGIWWVDAACRQVETTQDLGSPIFIPPVVAGGRMYVLTDKARLIALN